MSTLINLRTSAALAALVALTACDPNPPLIQTAAPTSVETTATYEALRNLPAPKQPVPVAVYSYPDLTGQFKAAETVSTNSRAVTQGAVWMLVKSLKDAAAGDWFKVIQRANLDNLLKERQIIRETRGRVEKQTGKEQPGLPSLLFAGVILEGGIIGYDSNTVTGGLGARYLGIGGDVQYRQDTVSVYLNAISSQTGEVMKSVMTRKTVVSYGMRGSVFKFVSFQKLLEGETGYTVNEPGQIALAQAIEHAVRSLIIEGALEGLWQFEDEIAGKEVTQAYLQDKEDDLLIGDASSLVAQTLLTEDQLKKIADARTARRERLEEQELRRQERRLVAERKKAEEEMQRELAAAQTQTPDETLGPIATPAQLAAIQRRQAAEKAGTSADVMTPEQQQKLVGLAAAEAEKAGGTAQAMTPEQQQKLLGLAAAEAQAAAPVQAIAGEEEAAQPQPKKVVVNVSTEKASARLEVPEWRTRSLERPVGEGEESEPLPDLAKEESGSEESNGNTPVVPTSSDDKGPRPLVQDPAAKPLPITQPGDVLKDDEEEEASLLDTVPKLKPAVSNVPSSVAINRLGLGGQTVKASDL
jgi:curli production assembly/transport component CsgG